MVDFNFTRLALLFHLIFGEGIGFKAVSLFMDVAYTSNIPDIAKDASKLYAELEPIAKNIFIEDPPFGIKRNNK